MPLPQVNQLPTQNDPYALLQGYLSRSVPDVFARQTNPKVSQNLQPPQSQPPIPTPAPPTGGGLGGLAGGALGGNPQPGPQDQQRLLQALSLQALIAQLASPFAGATPMGFFSHPNQYAAQYGGLTGNPSVAAMFDRGNVYKNSFQNRMQHPGNPYEGQPFGGALRGGENNPNMFMDPNVLAQAASIINAIVQSGGMMQGQSNA